jgi:hypothetical protein
MARGTSESAVSDSRQSGALSRLRRILALTEDPGRIERLVDEARALPVASSLDVISFIDRCVQKIALLTADIDERGDGAPSPQSMDRIKMVVTPWHLDPADGCMSRSIFQA